MRRLRFLSGSVIFYFILVSFVFTCVIPPGTLANPSVEIVRPATDSEGNGTVWGNTQVEVSYHGDRDAPVVKIVLLLDGSVVKEYRLPRPEIGGTAKFDFRFTLASGQVHALCAKAIDAAGESAVATVTLQVQKSGSNLTSRGKADMVPPVISIYYPAQGFHARGIIKIKATGSDDTGITSVFFYVDGKLHTALMNAPPWDDTLDTTRLADGPHVIQAAAFDAAENEGKSAELTIIVENTKGAWTTEQPGETEPAQTPAAPLLSPSSQGAEPAPPVIDVGTAPVPPLPAAPAITVPAGVTGPAYPTPETVRGTATPSELGVADLLGGDRTDEPGRGVARTTLSPGLEPTEDHTALLTPAPPASAPRGPELTAVPVIIAYIHTPPAPVAPELGAAPPGAAPGPGTFGTLTPSVTTGAAGTRDARPHGQPPAVAPLPTELVTPSGGPGPAGIIPTTQAPSSAAPPAGQTGETLGTAALGATALTQAAARAILEPLQAAGIAGPAAAARIGTPPSEVQIASITPTVPAPVAVAPNVSAEEAGAALTQAAARAILEPLQAAGIAGPAAAARIGTPPSEVQIASITPTVPAPAAVAPNVSAGEAGLAQNPYEAEATWNAAWGTPVLTVCPARDGQPPEQMKMAMAPTIPAGAPEGGVAPTTEAAASATEPSLPTTGAAGATAAGARTEAPGTAAPVPGGATTAAQPTPEGGTAATIGTAASETGPALPAASGGAAGARIGAPAMRVAMLPARQPAVEGPGQATVADNVPAAIAQIRGIQVVFNGQKLDLLTAPMLLQGISMAPLREIFEHTNGTLYWYAATKRVEAKNAQVDMKLQIGHPQAQVNGKTQTLVLAPFIKQGRTMVPLQFLADALNVTISYNPDSGQIVISSNEF